MKIFNTFLLLFILSRFMRIDTIIGVYISFIIPFTYTPRVLLFMNITIISFIFSISLILGPAILVHTFI